MDTKHQSDQTKVRNPEESGRYFHYLAEFVGFTEDDAKAIRESGLIIEKHLPEIIWRFYTNLLQYPPTRKFFLNKDGEVDDAYLQLRMLHQANFWRRTASGIYDDDYANFVDYVGRAHTSRGADPRVYIAERYVIGMVGFVQHAMVNALMTELHEYDENLEIRAVKAWNKLCMVILEMLARAYGDERDGDMYGELLPVDAQSIMQMSVDSYEKGLGLLRPRADRDIVVARAEEIPNGERKIIEVDGISIGIFHHEGNWHALRNSCLHRGGPVATGLLIEGQLICPWHGFTYNVTDGRMIMDPSAKLDTYKIAVVDGDIHLLIPESTVTTDTVATGEDYIDISRPESTPGSTDLLENEFSLSELPAGKIKLVHLSGRRIAVYNVDGQYYATQDECTHAGGPLSEGDLDGKNVTCPWHYSCFNVETGEATCKPAITPLETFTVILDGDTGRVQKNS